LPLADVMTFYLAAPLFVTILAVVFLGERIGPWRIAAVLLGFMGVVIALHPSGQALSTGAVVAVSGSLMFATAMIITRRLRQAHWVTLVAGQFFGAGVIGAVACSFDWVTPSLLDAVLMLLVGLVSMFCFLCINKALRLAQASILAPFHYTSIVWAVLLGWLVFGDLPTPAMWTGIGLIVASGAIVWMRERHAGQEPVVEAAAT
jgi:S-adenosylmethionine uptake transporter